MLGLLLCPRSSNLCGVRILRQQLKIQRAPSDLIKRMNSTETNVPASEPGVGSSISPVAPKIHLPNISLGINDLRRVKRENAAGHGRNTAGLLQDDNERPAPAALQLSHGR